MSEYRAPTTDMMFVLEHIADLGGLSKRPGFEHADPDTVAGVLDEAARFMEEQVAPLNRIGDEVGVRVEGDVVVRQAAEAHDLAVDLDDAPGVRTKRLGDAQGHGRGRDGGEAGALHCDPPGA